MSTLSGKQIVLGVSGSIAAYKSVELLRRLTSLGASVKVVLTPSACRFVPPLSFQVLSGHPVYSEPFEPREEVLHLSLAEEADLILIAPATAHFLAKAALGLADDLLSTLLLGARSPLVVAPAMDGGMWEHPAVQQHAQILRDRGVRLIGPVSGPLASGMEGPGRMAEPSIIASAVESMLTVASRDLQGEVVLVTAGPTREPIDPVRHLSNRSSGKMGYALAERARDRGAEVILVSGPTALPRPRGVEFHPVVTAEEMEHAVLKHLSRSSILIMAAAVGDFRIKAPALHKIKKRRGGSLTLELVETEDILEKVQAQKGRTFVVGFAAETEKLHENAQQKLRTKGMDLIVGNPVGVPGVGFESDDNQGVVFGKGGRRWEIPRGPKGVFADRLFDLVGQLRQK